MAVAEQQGSDELEQAATDAKGFAVDAQPGTTDMSGFEESVGGGSEPGPAHSSGQSMSGRILSRFTRKRLLAGVGAGGGAGVIGILVFLAFLPFKLEHIMKNLEQKEESKLTYALEKRSEKLLSRYVTKRVLRRVTKDGKYKKISKVDFSNEGYATDLFNTWQDVDIEQLLADNQGMRIRAGPGAGEYIFEMGGREVKFTGDFDFDKIDSAEVAKYGSRGELRIAASNALKKQTYWDKVKTRRQVRLVDMAKYQVKRWRLFQKPEDHISDDPKDFNANSWVSQTLEARVMGPYNNPDNMNKWITCLLVPGCDYGSLPGEQDRAPKIDADLHIDTSGPNEVDEQRAKTDPQSDGKGNITEEGSAKKLSLKGAKDLLAKSVRGLALSNCPGLPPAICAANDAAILTGDLAPGKDGRSKWTRVVTSVHKLQYVNLFLPYRTATDELHQGHLSLATLGVLVSRFNGMEQSPMYASIFHLPRPKQQQKCSGKKLADTELVCDDKKIVPPSYFLQGFFNSPIGKLLSGMAQIWNATGGLLISLANQALGLPAQIIINGMLASLKAIGVDVGSALDNIIGGIFNDIIPPVATGHETGPDLINGVDAGLVTQTNDVARVSLGGGRLTNAQVTVLDQTVDHQDKTLYNGQPFLARLTNLDNLNSVASRLVAAIPINPASWFSGLFKIAAMPMDQMGNLALTWATPTLNAASTNPNPWNADINGYQVGCDDLKAQGGSPQPGSNCFDYNYDPSQYGGSQCDDDVNNAAASDEDLPQHPANSGHDVCRLEYTATNSARANFTSDDDGGLGDNGNGTGGGGSGSSSQSSGAVTGKCQQAPCFPIEGGSEVAPGSWTLDQGVDISTNGGACGNAAPEVAMYSGTIAREGISGFGPDAPVIKLDQGTKDPSGKDIGGRYIYYGHALGNTVKVGDHVTAGQVITHVGCGNVGLSTGPHIEIGISAPGGPDCCPAMRQTSPYMEQILNAAWPRHN
jgi:hypothetical protein